MWFDLNNDDMRLTCPRCGVSGHGMRLSDAEPPPYFCLSCLSRSDRAEVAERKPGLIGRLLGR